MVFLKVKKSEEEVFIFESKTDIPVDEVIRSLVQVYNRRIKLQYLVQEVEQLKLYGRMKSPEQLAQDEENNETDDDASDPKKKEGKDPSGRRENQPPSQDIQYKIEETLYNARALLKQSTSAVSDAQLLEAISLIKGAVMIAYPMGLPKYDSVEELLYGDFSYPEYHDADTASLWFVGKELTRDKKLMDNKSIGRNEKTTIVVKLYKKGQGAPTREEPISAEEQKRLMAYWYKKQEEHKKLLEDEDDNYLNSNWANPKGLKQHFHGLDNVNYRPALPK